MIGRRSHIRFSTWLGRGLWGLVLGLALATLPGAGCRQMVSQQALSPVRVLPETPTLEQVVQVVNGNTERVENLLAPGVSVSGNAFPQLTATLAYERPRNLRLRAKTAFSGPEVDLGSNAELFWFWVRRNDPPAVYFCRHEDFAGGAATEAVPVDPDWLIEALGLVWFDPAERHEGPVPLPDGRLEVRTYHETPQGLKIRLAILDPEQGWVVEQHLYDESGRRLATALASDHRRDPASDVVLPRQISLEWPPARLTLTLDLREVEINRAIASDPELWTKPSIPDAAEVNLAEPRGPVPQDDPLADERSGTRRW